MSNPGGASQAVAIIGIGCRFPGGVVDAASFWQLLQQGRDAIGEIPSARIDLAHYFDPRPATPGRIMTRWGGFLDGIEQFDAGFFGISPREAERLDPQQRLVLETAWEALEDGGQDVPGLKGSRTGVFVGQWLSDFEGRLFADPEGVDFFMTTGSGRYATSGRLSYLLGLQGPSLTVDTACSSSLVALHMAARSLRHGECELALAGGVNVILQPQISVAYSQSRMMAPDGHCKFGDAAGDGYVRSEGAAMVLLKPLAQALRDGDRVYAVVRGSAVNNDGQGSGSMGTPSRAGQEALLRTAYADAGVAPGKVGLVEAHGTGTRAGDPVELGALAAVLGEGRAAGSRALVGSVKTNIGHTEGAAGAAGFIKLALSLHHGAIPASLHCNELNPAVSWSQVPLQIAREPVAWNEADATGGVSAFGIAGTNAHLVLQRAPPMQPVAPTEPARALAMLPLSARSPEALQALAARHARLLAASGGDSLLKICGAAAHSRSALEQRAVLVAGDAVAMRAALERFAVGEPAAAAGVAPVARPRIAFVVPGQGAQWQGMARELLLTEPVFRESLQRCDAAARRQVQWSILQQLALEPDAPGYLLDRIDVIQPVLVALAIAYADWLAACGVRPDAVVGHSMGEVGAAYLCGALDLDAAMRIICRRSALMRETSGRGAMALVDLSIADAQARIGTRADRVAVAVSNSPRSSVISGEPAAVDAILAECEREGVFCRRVKVDVASHSPQMDTPAAQLRAELHDLTPAAQKLALYSTVLAQRADGTALDADYWARNMRQPVRFGDTIGQMMADGISVFVELGPHPVLLPAIQQSAPAGHAVVTIGCARRDEPEQRNLLDAAAALWAAGVRVDWQVLQPYRGHVDLPLYPWQRERYWLPAAEQGAQATSQQRRGAPGNALHPLLGAGTELAASTPGWAWNVDLAPRRNVDVLQHRLFGAAVMPASLYLELGFAALRAADAQATVRALRDLQFERPLYLDEEDPPALQLQLSSKQGATRELSWFGDGGSGWVRHAHAQALAATDVEAIATVGVPATRGAEISGSDFYAGLAQRGAAFGAELTAVQACWPIAGGWEAELVVGESAPYRQRLLPPAVLDACFQLAAWSAPAGDLWLPAALEAATLLRAPRGAVRLVLHTVANAPDLRCEVHASDAEGVFLRLTGMQLQRLGSAAIDPASWRYAVRWRAVEAAQEGSSSTATCVLVLGGGSARIDGMAMALIDNLANDVGTARLPQWPADVATLRAAGSTRLEIIDLRPLADAASATPAQLEASLQATVVALRELQSAGISARYRLATANACAVDEADAANLQPWQAAFWGLGASLAAECGDSWGGCLDIGSEVPETIAGQAIAQRSRSGSVSDAALRRAGWFERELQRTSSSAPTQAIELRADATYLVTGGFGDVGRQVTRWLVEQGARRLLVLGRRPLLERRQWSAIRDPARRSVIDHVRALEALGASVHYAAVDVADAASLTAAITDHEAAGWPAIRGVVHAAGVAQERLALSMQPADWHPVLSGKAVGAWQLHRALPQLDFFVMFSSMAALLPEPGQASYAAANAVLDAIATARAATAGSGVSLSMGWGIWSGLGMMGGAAGEKKLRQIEQRGVQGFVPAEGLRQLQAAMASGHSHLLVMPVEWRTYGASRAGRVPAIVRSLADAATVNVATKPVATALQPAERRQQLEAGVRAAIAKVLKIPAARIDARKPLGSMGLGSLLAMELRNSLEALVERQLSATLAWNYPTVDALVAHLAGEEAVRAVVAAEAPAPAPDIDAVSGLSDDEAALLLMRRN